MKATSRRLLATAILGANLAATSATTAAADPSHTHRFPIDNSGDNGTYTGYCAFPVDLNVVKSKEYAVKYSTAPDGTTTERITGSLVVTLTNDISGVSETVNTSGPVTLVTHPDGSVSGGGQGHQLVLVPQGSPPSAGPPGMYVTTGNLVVAFDSSGDLTSWSTTGKVTNMCTELG